MDNLINDMKRPFFILEDALSVQKDKSSSTFLYEGRIIRLDELGQTFVVRLVILF